MLGVLAFCLVLTNFFDDTNGLMCYECNSLYDPECGTLKQDSRFSFHYKFCQVHQINETVLEYSKPLCRRIKQRIKVRNNMEVIKLSCGWEMYKNLEEDVCYENKNEDRYEIVCQCFSDGCNSSNRKFSNFLLIFASTSLLVIFKTAIHLK